MGTVAKLRDNAVVRVMFIALHRFLHPSPFHAGMCDGLRLGEDLARRASTTSYLREPHRSRSAAYWV